MSPDRQWLVYDSNERGTSDIYWLSLGDAASRPEPLTRDSTQEFWVPCHPTGKTSRIMCMSKENGGCV